jgi:hypothetical protein
MVSPIGLLKSLRNSGSDWSILQVCAGQPTNSWGGLSVGQEEDRSGLGGGANITAVWVGHRLNSVADPDPGYDAFLTPVSGIRDEQPGSYFLELRSNFFGLKYLNSLMRIRDGKVGS